MTHDPVPQRLSDADRDTAVTALRQHYEAGRLSDDEFADRSSKALAARVASEVDALFTDLPDPHPLFGAAAPSPWAAPGTWGQAPRPPFDPGNNTWPTTQPNWPGATPSSWGTSAGAPVPPPSYTPAPYAFTPPPAQQDPRREWVSVVRKAVWPALFLGAIITGHWTIWIAIGIIATIVLTQVGGRTRKPPPY